MQMQLSYNQLVVIQVMVGSYNKKKYQLEILEYLGERHQ